MAYEKHYIPLESDPAIFTDLMHDMGVSPSLEFIDIWSLDDSLVATVRRPVLALILILPPCPTYEKQQKDEREALTTTYEDGELVWLKQTINNACGLYAILHSVCNIPGIIEPDTILDYLSKSGDRTAFLDTSDEIERVYMKAALKGCSEAPYAQDEVDHHYISLVKRSSRLYVLDGDMEGPIDKGYLEEDEDVLGQQGLDIIREYTLSNMDGMFSLLALVKS